MLRVEADNTWPDGTPDVVHVEALESPQWLAGHESKPGAVIPLPLDLTDVGLPKEMICRVLANEPCPPIEAGRGRVVLATVNHLNDDVRELDVIDQLGRRETIRPTGLHKFYSATRDGWVSTKDLEIGEELKGASGPVYVRALRLLPGPRRVYNMSVEDEHVYRVSTLGVLVHNSGCGPIDKGPNFLTKVRKHIEQVRNRLPVKEAIPKIGQGGADRVWEIIQARVAQGGGRTTVFAGEAAIAFEDSGVTYIFRPSGEFWTILAN